MRTLTVTHFSFSLSFSLFPSPPSISLYLSLSLSFSISLCNSICIINSHTLSQTTTHKFSHVGTGCCFLSCVFFLMLCLYPSLVLQLLGQGLSCLLSSSLVASLYVILVCPFLPCCLLAGLKGKCFPVAGTAQIIPADYLTNATCFSLSFPFLFSSLDSCPRK